MREKIEQQTRYAEQVKIDLEVVPRRIKNQQKAVCVVDRQGVRVAANEDQIFNFIAQRDMATNIELAQSSRKIAEESRRDNLLNIEIAKATAQVAEETRQDSAAMKTIAVLTLTFLPGTAVAVREIGSVLLACQNRLTMFCRAFSEWTACSIGLQSLINPSLHHMSGYFS